MFKNMLIIAIIVTIVMSCTACTSTVDTSGAEKVNDTVDSATDNITATEEKAVDKVFKVNEEIKLKNTLLTVTAVEKQKGNEYEAKPGIEYIVISVKMKNASVKERISYNSLDFRIENSKGVLTDESYLGDVETLDCGDLTPSGEISGKIVFEVPENDPKLTLEYQPSWLSDSVIRVALNY